MYLLKVSKQNEHIFDAVRMLRTVFYESLQRNIFNDSANLGLLWPLHCVREELGMFRTQLPGALRKMLLLCEQLITVS